MLSSLFPIISTSLLWHLVFRFPLNAFIFPHAATQTALSLKTNSGKNLQVQQKLEQNIPAPRAGWELLVCSCRCPGFWTTWSQTEFRASGNALRPVLGKTPTTRTNRTRSLMRKVKLHFSCAACIRTFQNSGRRRGAQLEAPWKSLSSWNLLSTNSVRSSFNHQFSNGTAQNNEIRLETALLRLGAGSFIHVHCSVRAKP